MKWLAKIAALVLIVGGIVFAVGTAMGGTVYSSWYGGRLHPWRESFNIGWDGHRSSVRQTVDDVLDSVDDTIDDALDGAFDDAFDDVFDDAFDNAHHFFH